MVRGDGFENMKEDTDKCPILGIERFASDSQKLLNPQGPSPENSPVALLVFGVFDLTAISKVLQALQSGRMTYPLLCVCLLALDQLFYLAWVLGLYTNSDLSL